MVAAILLLNAMGWTLLVVAADGHVRVSGTAVFGIGTGVLAYTLGMRHAFDADHIAAIDNTTRKMVSEGKRPLTLGFFFALGHSSVVFVLALLLNFGVRALGGQVGQRASALHSVTTIVGTAISGSFLYLIGIINLCALIGLARVWRRARTGGSVEAQLEQQLNSRGLLNRLLRGVSGRIDKPWKMYPLGLLFGLGFDTATEVALLVLAGTSVAVGLPFYAVLSLPILFAAGMTLFDTADGWVMSFVYHRTFADPRRKAFYSLVMTGLSVAVAFLIGTVELVGLIASHLRLHGPFFRFVESINLNVAGYGIVVLFLCTWVVALLVWRPRQHGAKLEPITDRA